MIFYYSIIAVISLAIVTISYAAPDALWFLWNEAGKWFADTGMILLWITLLVKPVFMILMKHSELKTISFSWLRDYLKTIRWRSLKWLRYMLISILYFIAALGMKYRRTLWITTFLVLFTHAGINVGHRLNNSFTLASQLNVFWILSGYIALVCLFIGFLTSNDFSIRLFKRHRKTIQSLAYIALVFAILHVAFFNLWEYIQYYIVFVVYFVLKIVEKKK